MNRAYSVLDIKSVDAEKRLIEGIASTPTPDRMNDVIELDGMEFALPLPFLYQHNSRQPIGHVIEARKTRDGLRIKAQIAGDVAPFIGEAWALIKAGLIRGLSIGFRPIEEAFNKETGGFRFIKTELFEISAVTIPANAEASILTVKSADSEALAALGQKRNGVVRLANTNSAGVSAKPQGNAMKKTIAEQILDFQNKRAANAAAMDGLMEKSGDESRSLNAEESENYDNLERENKDIDLHLERLKKHEAQVVGRAQSLKAETAVAVADPQKHGEQVRRGEAITVRKNEPKGIAVARVAIALHNAKGIKSLAADMARKHWPDSPEVELILRTGVDAGDTTTSGWASQLVPAAANPTGEFLEMLRDATILGRIPGLRRVPFNVAIPIQTGSGTYAWVGEAAAKPVGSLTFDSVTLRWAKAAGIIVITQELAKFSSPQAEVIIRDEMIQSLTRFIDAQFVSTTAEVSNVSPAGILNGISATAVTGATAALFRVDMNTMLKKFATNKVPLNGLVLLMSSTSALALSLMVTDLGVALFPSISQNGGSILGIPVVISEAVGTKIIALYAPNIFLAQDDGINIDVSTEASVEMETTPAVGEQSPLSTLTNLKSFWQNNLIGFRVEQFITWKRGRTAAVEYLSPVAYVP